MKKVQVEALLAIVHEDIPLNFRTCDLSKEIRVQSLKLGKARGFEGIPNECIRHLPRRPLLNITHKITAFGLVTSRHLGGKQKSQLCRNTANTPNFSKM
jgi:hypothetical protein